MRGWPGRYGVVSQQPPERRGRLPAASGCTNGPALAIRQQNKAAAVMVIPENILRAQIAAAKDDTKHAIELLQAAVDAEDHLSYMEPKDWYIPARESLGGILLRSRSYAEAEKVFRSDLEKNLRSGRSLYGLAESLRGQGKKYDAQMVELEFEEAWKNADTKLRVEDL